MVKEWNWQWFGCQDVQAPNPGSVTSTPHHSQDKSLVLLDHSLLNCKIRVPKWMRLSSLNFWMWSRRKWQWVAHQGHILNLYSLYPAWQRRMPFERHWSLKSGKVVKAFSCYTVEQKWWRPVEDSQSQGSTGWWLPRLWQCWSGRMLSPREGQSGYMWASPSPGDTHVWWQRGVR